jgi:HK97 family phage major capsid protein
MYSSTSTNASGIAALFGDLKRGMRIGRRRGITLRASAERYLDSDQIAILGTQRFDISTVGAGDNTNPSALVALQFASS